MLKVLNEKIPDCISQNLSDNNRKATSLAWLLFSNATTIANNNLNLGILSY
jgi:hypothetical protein